MSFPKCGLPFFLLSKLPEILRIIFNFHFKTMKLSNFELNHSYLALVIMKPQNCRKLFPDECRKLFPNECRKLFSNECRKLFPNQCRKLFPNMYAANYFQMNAANFFQTQK